MEWPLTATTVLFFLVSFKKFGFLPFPTAFILILAIVQSTFTLVHDGVISYEMLSVIGRGGLYKNFIDVHILYSAISAFSLIAMHGSSEKLKNISINFDAIASVAKSKAVIAGTNVSLVLIVLHLIFYAMVVNWDVVWFHKKYLSPLVDNASVDLLGSMFVNTVTRFLLVMSGLSAVTFIVSLNARRRFVCVVSGLISLFYFCLLFSFHSRSCLLIPIIIGANFLVTKPKLRLWILLFMTMLVLTVLASALEGRSRPWHGLSSIPVTLASLFSPNAGKNIVNVIANIAEGSFSTSESFQITAPFSDRYKLLAFSPLPSFVDGYSKIMSTDEHRLHLYAPMSGYAEAILFGWQYFILLLVILYCSVRLHLKLLPSKPTLFIGCNFLFLISMHYMFAYPVRNALRFVWLAGLLSLLALLTLKRSAGRGAVAQVPSSGPRANVMRRKAKIGVPVATKHE